MEELELTFLIKELPIDLAQLPKRELLDIYIPAKSEHPSLRIRKAGDKYEITKKQPVVEGDASRQIENTIPLTKDEIDELSAIAGKRVQKTRYYYEENNFNYEIDVFGGELAGLILVDVEFKTVEEKSNFVMPSWCLVDVTQEKIIAGRVLSGKSFANIEDKLNDYGYKKMLLNS